MKSFNIKEIDEDIYLVEETGYLEFANIFIFADNNKCLIFDSGTGNHNLKQFLQKLGYLTFMVTSTHSHFDHIGGLINFDSNEIFLTKKMNDALNDPESYAISKLDKSEFGSQKSAVKLRNNFPLKIHTHKITNSFKFGKFDFQLLDAPGHSADSLMFYEKNNKILISGDSLYHGTAYLDLPDSSANDFGKTLKLIAKLKPLMVLSGHNEILKSSKIACVIDEWLRLYC